MENKNQLATIDYTLYNSKENLNVIDLTVKIVNKKTTDGSRKWKELQCLMWLEVIDANGVNIGYHNTWVKVSFNEDAFKNVNEFCNIKSASDITRSGHLYVLAENIQSPYRYEVKPDKNGKLKWPCVWITGGIVGFKPNTVTQDAFTHHEFIDAQEEKTFDAEEIKEVEEV